MTIKTLMGLFLVLFISCNSGDSGSSGPSRGSIIQGILAKGFTGKALDMDGEYEGGCRGTATVDGSSYNLEDCEFFLSQSQSEFVFSMEIEFFFNVQGQSYNYGIAFEDLLIRANEIVYEGVDEDEVVGEIGDIGLGMKDGKGFLRMVTSGNGVFYFDGKVREEGGLTMTVESDLKKR